MRALIFGAGGQDGFYLRRSCIQRNIEVFGCSRNNDEWLKCDISQKQEVESLVRKYKPDFIFHIAANSTTSHDALFDNNDAIITGTFNVLEAVYQHLPGAKVFLTGSGVQFENTGNPICEHDRFEANSPYSVARIASVYAGRYYRSLGLKVYTGYLFHHESPRRSARHVSKKIAELACNIRNNPGLVTDFVIGDISVQKEWSYAGDIAEGVLTLVSQNDVFEATIGSGEAYAIEDWLNVCFEIIERDWRDYVKVEGNYVPEYKLLVSDPSTIRSLGWSPAVGIRQLARLMLDTESD